MAPEVALGQYVDGRADLYALGCVAYYLLTGQPVFSADSDVATALAHVKDVPDPPSVRSEFNIPPALESLILDSLAKDPGDRPAAAHVFSDRFGTAVPHVWTSRDAHAWWELHRVEVVRNPEDSATPAAAGEAADAPAKGRRCWPRFDRKPLTKAPLAQ
jgi:serine/threonine-protein kinase